MPWIDQPSRLVLGYVAEHVELEHVAVLAARRSEHDPGADLGELIEVAGLPDDAADVLLADAGVTNVEVRRRLREAGGGNPLVLVEAANLLDDAERSGRAMLPDPLPVGQNGRQAAELALERLDPAARDALVVVAADSDGDAARIGAALAHNGHPPDALGPALAAGVLLADDDRLTFRHPLIRSATYHGARRSELRAAHRVLAATLPSARRRAPGTSPGRRSDPTRRSPTRSTPRPR